MLDILYFWNSSLGGDYHKKRIQWLSAAPPFMDHAANCTTQFFVICPPMRFKSSVLGFLICWVFSLAGSQSERWRIACLWWCTPTSHRLDLCWKGKSKYQPKLSITKSGVFSLAAGASEKSYNGSLAFDDADQWVHDWILLKRQNKYQPKLSITNGSFFTRCRGVRKVVEWITCLWWYRPMCRLSRRPDLCWKGKGSEGQLRRSITIVLLLFILEGVRKVFLSLHLMQINTLSTGYLLKRQSICQPKLSITMEVVFVTRQGRQKKS